ncbi:MAG: iron-sulfur cluster-binding FAD-binding oxidoreductase [Candidatus Aminicenantes bacterium]|nr:iron-sulfur cluster-binding FAD-binding oxidoreductase [Candidatus Aminicenantes bacterium]
MAPVDNDILKTASQCRHYAMCKIDYLGTGLCPPGKKHHYVSYYPQGRMDLYAALASGLIPVTDELVRIAETCTLCGVCDLQCHFVTGLRPLRVMKALKERVEDYLKKGGIPVSVAVDEPLRRLRAIVGGEWATNDPAVLVTYANDPFPLADMLMPRYVVLPGSREEVAAAVRLAGELGLPFAVRGNGGSVFGFVFSEGIVLDMQRMRNLSIDKDNWTAAVGPGVTSFELQQEASRHGLRANTAEPAATVCGNIVCTGTFSTWSHAYGTAADGFIDMEFVDSSGRIFRLNDKRAPNVFAFDNAVIPAPGVCTEAKVKLHPTTPDEDGLLVPFWDFDEAVALARELGRRRIGLAVAVLGIHYIANFMSPSKDLTERLKSVLPESLGIRYVVVAIGDRFARDAIQELAGTVIDSGLWRTLTLGLPRLLDPEWQELVRGFEGGRPPYETFCRPEMRPLIEAALDPSPETLAGAVDQDLRGLYAGLYAQPRFTDMTWLNMFRILSSRMSRRKHMFAFLVYVPLDRTDVINHINAEFARVAEAQGLDHDFGFLTPMDLGKRAILEYDYYIDHTDPAEREKIRRAMAEIGPWLDGLAERTKGVTFLKYVFSQGCSRMENFLYR